MGIRVLPPLVVNQIAAGEVIERPASAVKELIENALDAGATRVSVTVEQGGRELIEVVDDGKGIAPEELALALAPHATSKLGSAEDLEAIGTLGFRGEALASIASVSRLTLMSRTAEAGLATKIEAEGGEIGKAMPAGGPVGTRLTVRNLFYNTPARRKFLKTVATEYGHILEAVQKLALSHPAVGFALTHDGRLALDLPSGQSPKERVIAVLGEEAAGQLLEVSADERGPERSMSVWGMAGLPAIARGSGKWQHVFVNGRAIREKTVLHAIKEAYRGVIDPDKTPTVVLYIEMDARLVDVNVHPTKSEVRFRDSQSVHGLVLGAIRERLLQADLTRQVSWDGAPASVVHGGGDEEGGLGFNGGGTINGAGLLASISRPMTTAREFVEHFRRMEPVQRSLAYQEVKRAMEPAAGDEPGLPMQADSEGRPMVQVLPARIMQVHNSYLVVEDESGIEIVDQHALHERVMFEELKARVLAGSLESQRLLMPATLEASAEQTALLEGLGPLFERLGIEATAMGPRTIAVHGFPSFLFERGVEPAEFMAELLGRAAAEGFTPGDEGAVHEVLDMMACKAAVKAGDRMKPEEIGALLARRGEIERGGSCPHGRPTTIRLSLKDLEKQFERR